MQANHILDIFLISSILAFASIIIFATKTNKISLFDLFPSWSWISFAVLPYLYLKRYFPTEPARLQEIGLILTTYFILSADFIASRKYSQVKLGEIPSNVSGAKLSKVWHVLAFLSTTLIISHFINFGIPLTQLFNNQEVMQVSLARQVFTKATNFTQIYFYILNYVLFVLAPLVLLQMLRRKKYTLFSAFFILMVFYSIASTAKSPLIQFILIITFLLLPKSKIRPLNLKIVFAWGLSLVLINICLISSTSSLVPQKVERVVSSQSSSEFPNHKMPTTPADLMRDQEYSGLANHISSYFTYRILLVPMEVSNRWYDYWSPERLHSRSIMQVLEFKEIPKASNLVGVWAYATRFPEHYLKSVNANASLDADAYSLGGFFYVVLIGIAYFVIRLLVSKFSMAENSVLRDLHAIGIALLTFLPFQASFQAIIGAQGVGIVIMSMIFIQVIKSKAR